MLAVTAILVLVLGSVGGAIGHAVGRTVTATAVAAGSDTTQLTVLSLTPEKSLPGSFWGTTVLATVPVNDTTTLEVNSTPAREIVWPGGYLGDQMDYLNGTIHGVGGGTREAVTNASQFVKWCQSAGCHAVFQVPGEIDSPSTAARDVQYVEQTLHFSPDLWEIGNEPALWKKFGLPWSQWANRSTSPPTPTQYAELVHQYISAMKAVDSHIPIVGLPGVGKGAFGETKWLSATVSVNGPNLSAVGIHVYPGGQGPSSAANATLQNFLGYLNGTSASLPVRVPPDLAAIQAACPSCAPIPLMVSEFGTVVSGYYEDGFIGGFPQVPFVAAELVQAIDLNLSQMAYWTLDEAGRPPAWFPATNSSHPIYQLYSEILSRLGDGVLPLHLSSSVGGVYAVATTGNATSPVDLLVVNANASHSISFSTTASGLNASGPFEVWTWNSSSTDPVVRYWPSGLPTDWQEPAASVVLFEQPRTPTFPLSVNEVGLPASTRWYLTVGELTGTTNSSRMTFFLPNGQYDQTFPATEYIAPGERLALSLPPTVTIQGAPVTENGTYGLEYLITTSSSPAVGGTTSPSSAWVSQGGTVTISATSASGYGFVGWQGTGSGSYTGSANPVSIAPSGPVTEVATFSAAGPSQYSVSFDESGLPSGTAWWVQVGSHNLSGTSSVLSVSLANGSYSFTVSPVTGYIVTPSTGSVQVAGAPVVQSIAFTPIPKYPIWFNETGLPDGTAWSVTLNGTVLTGSTPSITTTRVNGTYPFTVAPVEGYTVDPSSSSVTVQGAPAFQSIVYTVIPPPQYPVWFNETGLPSGTPWWVNGTNGTGSSGTGSSITWTEPNGSYTYTVATSDKTYAAAGGTFLVDGNGVAVAVTFTRVTYAVTFLETGLPPGSEWWLNLTNGADFHSSTDTIRFSEPNGTYGYLLATSATDYGAGGGSFVVAGTSVSESVVFSQTTYSAVFHESGLPIGTEWWANVSGEAPLSSTGATIELSLFDGGYTFAIGTANATFAAPGGTFVVNGGNVSIPVTFALVTYSVSFTESGLPSGTEWGVALTNGGTFHGSQSTISFPEPNGTYAWSLTAVPGYTAYPSSGAIAVRGGPASEAVDFTSTAAPLYSVWFNETGLPNGTLWSVDLGGASQSTSLDSIRFNESTGTYAFSIRSVDRWMPSPGSGNVTVSAASTSVSIAFALSYSLTFTVPEGVANGTAWSVSLVEVSSGTSVRGGPAGGETRISTASSIVFQVPNATYSYAIGVSTDPSYRADGLVTVHGAPQVVVPPAVTPLSSHGSGTGISNEVLILASVAGVVAVGLVALLLAMRSRRRARPPR